MPFNSQGVYQQVSGAVTAAPGQIIASATWNNIHTDIGNALTALGQRLYGSTIVNLTISPYTPSVSDTFLLVDASGGPITINLPLSSSRNGYPLTIIDEKGVAAHNNITINTTTPDLINGVTPVVINSNFGLVNLFPIAGGWLNTNVQSGYLLVSGQQTTTGGFAFTSYNAGNILTGTVTPNSLNGNYQYLTNNGAFTLAAPAVDSAIDLLVTNGATAGAITFSGYTVGASTGDALDTVAGDKFVVSIRKINGVATYLIKGLQ